MKQGRPLRRNSSTPAGGRRRRSAPAGWLQRLSGLHPSLGWALAISVLLHGVLLALHFSPPEGGLLKQKDRGLEVVLVNARHTTPPDKADALAQANQDGGGESEQALRAKTPLPPQNASRDGDALMDAQRRVADLEARQQQLLTQARRSPIAANPHPQAGRQDAQKTPSGFDLLDSAAAITRLEGQIDREQEEYSRRPRKKFIGAHTQEYRFAQYVEDWRQKIERVGTLNYPDTARGKLYGSLLMSVVIRADGSVQSIEVHRSSGYPVLDDAARRIVQLAAPFAAFPTDIRRDTDVIEITRTWTFTNADKVKAE
ncbi:MAG: energy transducer TonB [Zoogloea sp.]|nr:energy transducer TonB [Zoogloea sp.]